VKWARENGAYSSLYGRFAVWRDVQLQRENGPSRIWKNGHEEWFWNGLRHREHGPAVVWPGGRKEWWLNGIEYTDETFAVEMTE
jgi:hypothetical protein